MKKLVLLAALSLTACAGHQAVAPGNTVYQQVSVPTPVSCVPAEVPGAPAGLETRQSLAAIPEGPERFTRLFEDWLRRTARMNQTEVIVAGCRRAAPPG